MHWAEGHVNPMLAIRNVICSDRWKEEWPKIESGLGEIHLIVDRTKIGSGHQLLMVAMTYRKRAIPIAWTWVKQVRGHSVCRQAIGFSVVCQKAVAQRSLCIRGRRPRIRFGGGLEATGKLALVLCSPPKIRYLPMAQPGE